MERTIRLFEEHRSEYPSTWAAVKSISAKAGMNPETLRSWILQAEQDAGKRPGLTTDERQQLKDLEKEVKELRRANEILKAASVSSRLCDHLGVPGGLAHFFAAQLRLWLFPDSPPAGDAWAWPGVTS